MKRNMKKVIPVICALGLFLACSLTVFAGEQPVLSLSQNTVSVTHDNTSEKVKISVKDWKGSKPYVVKYAVDDSSIVKVEVEDQKSTSFKLKIKAKGTGNTVVKVWLDGYSRNCQYISVNSIYYQRDKEDEYSVRHYGYMTGTKGEAAIIDDFDVENVDGEERLYVYFTLKDQGMGDGKTVVFTAKCEEDDGDAVGEVQATATGVSVGGSGYKVYFKIPNKTAVIKLVNDDL